MRKEAWGIIAAEAIDSFQKLASEKGLSISIGEAVDAIEKRAALAQEEAEEIIRNLDIYKKEIARKNTKGNLLRAGIGAAGGAGLGAGLGALLKAPGAGAALGGLAGTGVGAGIGAGRNRKELLRRTGIARKKDLKQAIATSNRAGTVGAMGGSAAGMLLGAIAARAANVPMEYGALGLGGMGAYLGGRLMKDKMQAGDIQEAARRLVAEQNIRGKL